MNQPKVRSGRFFLSLGAVLTMVVAVLVGPQAAQAAPVFSRNCPTGHVRSLANNLPIRFQHSVSSNPFTSVDKGYWFRCYKNYYELGDRYTACGVTNANGWIMVYWGDMPAWTYMTCLKDD